MLNPKGLNTARQHLSQEDCLSGGTGLVRGDTGTAGEAESLAVGTGRAGEGAVCAPLLPTRHGRAGAGAPPGLRWEPGSACRLLTVWQEHTKWPLLEGARCRCRADCQARAGPWSPGLGMHRPSHRPGAEQWPS